MLLSLYGDLPAAKGENDGTKKKTESKEKREPTKKDKKKSSWSSASMLPPAPRAVAAKLRAKTVPDSTDKKKAASFMPPPPVLSKKVLTKKVSIKSMPPPSLILKKKSTSILSLPPASISKKISMLPPASISKKSSMLPPPAKLKTIKAKKKKVLASTDRNSTISLMAPPPMAPRVVSLPQPVPAPRVPKKKIPRRIIETVTPPIPDDIQTVRDVHSEEIHEEYNPARPNDYEEFCLEREKRREREAAARRNKRDNEQQHTDFKPHVITPATKKLDLNVTGEEAYLRRQQMTPGAPAINPDIGRKLMNNMGWSGKGLGKSEQGITQPIEGRKKTMLVSRNLKNQKKHRVVLLTNMVGRGEVDADLEGEIRDECAKYGPVLNCVVYEVKNASVSDDQAVRIFVEFGNLDSAERARQIMGGRFFGGRVVKARYYSEDKFYANDFDA